MDEIVYRPIKSNATRMAALVSGELDLVQDPSLQDIPRLRTDPAVRVIEGPENRVIFLVMDQFNDELKVSNVKGKNPLKDVRVRKAFYHAIDVEAIKAQVMRGLSVPTGAMIPAPASAFPRARAAAPQARPGGREEAARRGRLPAGLRDRPALPQRPLRERRAHLHRDRRDAREGRRQGEALDAAARPVLPAGRPAQHHDAPLRLGRRRDRPRLHADAGAARPRRQGQRRLQLRALPATPSSTG